MADFTPNPRTAPSMISGDRGPEQLNQTRVIADVQDEILLYMPSASPLTTLTGKLRKKRTVTQSKFDFLTKDEYPRTVKLAATSNAADTTIDFEAGTGARIAANYVLLNTRTRESVVVTSMSGADQATVVRGVGSSAQDMEIGDSLVFTRAVFEDGTGKGTFKSVKEDAEFNYTEIIKTGYGFTGRQINTDLYGGKDQMTERKWFGIEHTKSIEKMMFFGTRHLITGTHQQTFSGGLEFFIKSNIWNLGGTVPSERAFVEFLEEGMRWGRGGSQEGSGTKYLFASSRWVTELEFFAKDKLQYKVLDKQIGLAAMEYVSAHGRVMIIRTPILDYNHPDFAFLVDLNHVRYVRHQGRDTKLMKSIEANDLDGSEEQYVSDVGCQVELEASHSILKGLSV